MFFVAADELLRVVAGVCVSAGSWQVLDRFLAGSWQVLGRFLALRFVLCGFGDLQMHVENRCKKQGDWSKNDPQIDAKSSK